MPVVIGAGGVEKVVEIALDDEAKGNLTVSVDAVKELLVACKAYRAELGMSVDFVVFDPDVAPRDGKRFRAWYDEQVDWDIDCSRPSADSILGISPLQRWYDSMTAQLPRHESDSI